MDIQDLGAIGEILGSLLVLVTLIYVAYQLRQTQRSMMSQTHQMRADGLKTTWQNLALSNEMLAVYSKLADAGWSWSSKTALSGSKMCPSAMTKGARFCGM